MLYPFRIYWTNMSNNSLQTFIRHDTTHDFIFYVHECVYILVLYSMKRPSSSSSTKYLNTYMRECVYLQKKWREKCVHFLFVRKYDVLLWVVVKFFFGQVFRCLLHCVFLWKIRDMVVVVVVVAGRYNSVVVLLLN